MGQEHHHGHDQENGHAHAHDAATTVSQSTLRAFAVGTLLNLGFTAIEASYGLITGSLALLSVV